MRVSACIMAVIAAWTHTVEAAVQQASFGTTRDGQAVEIYTLSNERGARARVITYGGILTELLVPRSQWNAGRRCFGIRQPRSIRNGKPYFGCITGRVANRIAGGQFTADGTTADVAVNNGPNHLHGSIKGSIKSFGTPKLSSGPTARRCACTIRAPTVKRAIRERFQ